MESSDPRARLRRLDHVWLKSPVYFVTTCTAGRKPLLAQRDVSSILLSEWHDALGRHGWSIGRYVIMPDHVHLFAEPASHAKKLSHFMAAWKQWTSKRIASLGHPAPVWQKGFFDHLLRSAESLSVKWDYVRDNPVRAGLVSRADDWPFQGFVHWDGCV